MGASREKPPIKRITNLTMVHANSIQTHKANAGQRNRQLDKVFDYLFARTGTQGVTAEEIGAVLKLPRSTVHARLNDLKVGYYYKSAYYFLQEAGVHNKEKGRALTLYSLTLTEPDPKELCKAEIKALERKIQRQQERLAVLKSDLNFEIER